MYQKYCEEDFTKKETREGGNIEMNKKLKRNFNEERGITLIALIITIIILVILAAVSVRAVYNMGIVNHAVNGTQKYSQEAVKENQMLGDTSNTIQDTVESLRRIQSIDTWDGISKTKPQIDKNRNWHIYTCAELKFFADFVNGELTEEEHEEAINDGLEITSDTIVYLESNLDLGATWDKDGNKLSGTTWTPIGKTSATKFIGTFEGQKCTIQGIYINQEANFAGLFGNISKNIQNLTIKDSYIEGTNCIGGIVGLLNTGGIISNCHNINTTVVSKQGSYYVVGGVVGQSQGTVTGCTNTGNITAKGSNNGSSYCGGIIGNMGASSKTIDCTNRGTITGVGKYVGGIIALSSASTTITGCTNSGTVTGTGGRVGGIVGGANSGSQISGCINNGIVTGEDKNVAGIAGFMGSQRNDQ